MSNFLFIKLFRPDCQKVYLLTKNVKNFRKYTMDNNKYDETISDSKSESILKAISILESEVKNNEEKAICRPNISVRKIIIKHIIYICAFTLFCLSLFQTLTLLNFGSTYKSIISLVVVLIFLLLRFKCFCIDIILLYQKLAPEKLRRSCLFEPSCSEYMLLAIDKYGTFKGVLRGIKRLLRCHHPNGGVDYP